MTRRQKETLTGGLMVIVPLLVILAVAVAYGENRLAGIWQLTAEEQLQQLVAAEELASSEAQNLTGKYLGGMRGPDGLYRELQEMKK